MAATVRMGRLVPARKMLVGLLALAAFAAAAVTLVVAERLPIEVAQAELAYDQRTGEPIVTFRMTPASASAFAELTARNVGRTAAFKVDGRIVMRPVIREPILGGVGQISAHLSVAEARDLASRLASGTAKIEIEIIPDDGPGK